MEDGGGAALGVRDIHQGGQARIGPGRHHLQALGGERPIEAHELGDVADRPQSGQIEPTAKVRFRAIVEQAPGPRLAIEGGEHDEGDSGGGQTPLPRSAVRPIGIDDQGAGDRRGVAHQVMVDDHYAQSDLIGGGQGGLGGGAAVDGDHQLGA